MNVDTFMKSYSMGIIRYRWLILIAIICLTGFLGYAANDLTVNNDYDTWLPSNDKVSELYRIVDNKFASNALVFAVLDFTEKGVFNPESLALVRRLTEALEEIPGLFMVTSLTNIVDIRKTDFGVEVGDLIPKISRNDSELEALKAYVLSKEMYVNALISADAAYTVLVVNIHGSAEEVAVAESVLHKIEEVVGDQPYYFGGDPALSLYLDRYMTDDMGLLIPLMLMVMVIILAVIFQRFWAVVLPLGLVVLCVLWTFGLQSVFRIYANLLTPAVAVLLIAMGADYAVHVYNHYLKRGNIRVSTAEISLPVIMSAVTTVAGLLTFATTKIEILRFFGIELAFGLGSACILSILLLPVLIYLFKAKPAPQEDVPEQEQPLLSQALIRLGGWVRHHTTFIIASTFIGLVVMGLGIFRITTNVNFVDLLPSDCPARKGHNIIRDHFSGIYPISIYSRGEIEAPAVMQMENYIENYLRSKEMLSSFTSINGLIAEENWLMNGVYAVPETRAGIANLWLLLEGEELLKTFVSSDRRQSLVTGMIKEPDTGIMKGIAQSVSEFLDKKASDQVFVIDPARLSPDGRQALRALNLSEAAIQLTWLAQGYDKPRQYNPEAFLKILTEKYSGIEQTLNLEKVWEATWAYLSEETVEVLPPELIKQIQTHLMSSWQKRDRPEYQARIIDIITANQVMESEDAKTTATGVLRRAGSVLRLLQARALRESLSSLLSPGLVENKDFRKRAEGVLWRLWAEHPVFFANKVASVPGVAEAVIGSKDVEIDQTGMPDLFRRFDELLFISQVQSLLLASLIVLVLVSLTQLSIRRGLISLFSVLVPLGFILGIMGWVGIPLDFGTVLFGALIIGLGVDGSIHFLHYYHHLQLQGIKGEAALRETMGHVGKAIVTANATTCCGFLVLVFSKTSALKNFAFVNSIAIFLVTVSILTFLPALVTLFLDDS